MYSQAGVEQAGRDLGIDVQFKVGDWTTAKQKQIVDDLLVSGAAGVAISPTNPKDQKMMINEWSSFIPVVCADSDSAESKRVAFVGTDNVEAGRMCGELLKEALPKGGKVMVFVGLKDAHSASTRYQGLQESLQGSNIEIIDLRTDNGDRVKARKNAEDTITKYPDLAAMVGLWNYNAPAILGAVESAGKIGQIQIVGFDEDPVTLLGVAEGKIYGTICQDPYEYGYGSITLLHDLIVRKRTLEEAGVPANKKVIVPTKAVRKDDALDHKKYCDDLKKALTNKS